MRSKIDLRGFSRAVTRGAGGATLDVSRLPTEYAPVFKASRVVRSTSYRVPADERLVLVDTSAGDVVVTLPRAVDGELPVIVKLWAGASTLTVEAPSGQLIDGATTDTVTSVQWYAPCMGVWVKI